MPEANELRCRIKPTITASAKVFLDQKDLPLTYTNINSMHRKLVHRYIAPCQILCIYGNAINVDIPNNMTISDTVINSMLKVNRTDNSMVAWRLACPAEWTSCTCTCCVIESIANYQASSDGTSWKYEVKWKGSDEKDDT
jgi:hypothetical protein